MCTCLLVCSQQGRIHSCLLGGGGWLTPFFLPSVPLLSFPSPLRRGYRKHLGAWPPKFPSPPLFRTPFPSLPLAPVTFPSIPVPLPVSSLPLTVSLPFPYSLSLPSRSTPPVLPLPSLPLEVGPLKSS